jgi:hypothetical protein
VDNIKLALKEKECDGVDLIELAQDSDQWGALVNKVTNLRVPQNFWEFPELLHNWQLLRQGSAP